MQIYLIRRGGDEGWAEYLLLEILVTLLPHISTRKIRTLPKYENAALPPLPPVPQMPITK